MVDASGSGSSRTWRALAAISSFQRVRTWSISARVRTPWASSFFSNSTMQSCSPVTKVVPDAQIEAAAHEVAMSLATGPSIALGYIKRNINNAETMTLEACFDGEAIHHSRAGETADHKEAAKAFVEKRKPTFAGH